MEKICAFIILILCFGTIKVSAQTNRKVSGTVTDTAKVAIADANIVIITGNDTLKTKTDQYGDFSFSKINARQFSIKISTIGYKGLNNSYSFTEKEKHKRLEPIRLEPSKEMLKEVVIKGKPNPIRFMQDTVEYNADAFQVLEGDNVADLIKQFPGVEVDDEYNVKTMGKDMVKLRVNGKDFFTSNVKEFIGRLPAGIVSKIQVIDDFGDEANFTGIKVGEPKKMLNIVTKPGMSKGVFGNVRGNAGTNDMVGGGGQVNLWNNSKQRSANANVARLNNGAGNSKTVEASMTYRDQIGKDATGGFNYNFRNNSDAFEREQVAESVNPEGNFVNHSKNQGDNMGSNHFLSWNMHYNNKKIFLQTNIGGSYNHSDNTNSSSSNQYGIIRQDLNSSNSSTNSSPNIHGQIIVVKKLKNKANSFSIESAFSASNSNGSQNISTNTLYYDKLTGDLQKDSVLNRHLINKSNGKNFNIRLNYSLGLKKAKDSLIQRSLNFSYNGSINRSLSEVSTYVFDNFNQQTSFVDSLSTLYRSISISQSLGINYNYNAKKMRYNFGVNASPNMISNDDLRLLQKSVSNTLNYSPSINVSRNFAKGKVLSLNYRGSNRNPSINQLQPIKNTQNLQNIVIGNPDLKPSFEHNLNTGFNYAHIGSGISIQAGLNANIIQREIVEDVALVSDTLNSLKQITRFENVNGNYSFNSNYMLNIPIKKNKYSITYSGNVGFSNRAVIFNNKKSFGKGLNFSQSLNSNLSLKKLTLNTRLSYSLTNNNNIGSFNRFSEYQSIGIGQISAPAFFRSTIFSLGINGNLRLEKLRFRAGANYNSNHSNATGDQRFRSNSNLNLNLFSRLAIKKSYSIEINITKRANYGYALVNANPLLINTSLNKTFLKDKSLQLSLAGNDLLGQGNNISRVMVGNSIIDSRFKQQTRVFVINLTYNLSKFGGRVFNVDPD